MHYFLIDNGSLQPASVLKLRQIAHNLSVKSGHSITPMGLMHSHKINSSLLGGRAGMSMQAFLNSAESEQIDEIRVLPFFLGPSLAITEWLPENLNLWQRKKPTLRKFSILKPLFSENDDRLARASCELCWDQFKRRNLDRPRVAFVDHGTPLVTVNKVRELVGEKMKKVLGGQVDGFSTCAMERRPDPKYDFNNPLLETLLEQWQKEGVSDVVVSQFFLLPGRHAGPNGDLAEICRPYIEKGMNVVRTDNLGSHPLIEQILLDRINLDKA